MVLFTLSFDDYGYYGFKYIVLFNRLNKNITTELLKVQLTMQKDHSIQYEEALISGAIDCDAAVILVEAMSEDFIIANKLVLHLHKSCSRVLADIKYSRDRVMLIFVN